jgi:hypothetical protein
MKGIAKEMGKELLNTPPALDGSVQGGGNLVFRELEKRQILVHKKINAI